MLSWPSKVIIACISHPAPVPLTVAVTVATKSLLHQEKTDKQINKRVRVKKEKMEVDSYKLLPNDFQDFGGTKPIWHIQFERVLFKFPEHLVLRVCTCETD